MADLTVFSEGLTPAHIKSYRWVMGDGVHVRPHIMATNHLFNSFLMLWHHHMPAEYHVKPHKRYSWFNPDIYTPEYISMSVKILGAELGSRDDLTEEQARYLQIMAGMLRNKIPEGPKALISSAAQGGNHAL